MLVSFSILAIRSAVKLNILIYQGPPLSRRTPQSENTPEGTQLWNTTRRLRKASKTKENQACTAAAALQKEPPASKTIEKQSKTKQKQSKTKPEQQPPLSRRAAGICSSLVLLCFCLVLLVFQWFSMPGAPSGERRLLFKLGFAWFCLLFEGGGCIPEPGALWEVLLESGGP